MSKPLNRQIVLVALAAVLLLAAGFVWRSGQVGIDPKHASTVFHAPHDLRAKAGDAGRPGRRCALALDVGSTDPG